MDWVALAREFGVPLVGFAIFGYLIVRGILVTRRTCDYIEARRLEERDGRLKAEARLEAGLETIKEVTALANKYEAALRGSSK